MNFLQLCQALARETGTLAGGVASLSTVSGATGRMEKIISWTRDAWIDIQNSRQGWRWMQRDFTSNLIAGKARYTAGDFSLSRVARWERDDNDGFCPYTIYDPDRGQSDEGQLREIDWRRWLISYGRGVHDANRPTEYAVSPQDELCFGSKPDKAYPISGTYWLTPQVLTANTDTPEMPERFHRLIVWRAIELMAISDEAPVSINTAISNAALLRDDLERDQLPRIQIGWGGGPIA